jgi:hypothetical protein
MCNHAMPIGSASDAAVPHCHNGTQMHRETGRWRSGSGVWTLRRSTFLPPTFSLRLYYLASAAQQEHPTEQIPRQDQINPPSFVNNHLDVRKRNKTCPPACIFIVILGFVCRMILCVCVLPRSQINSSCTLCEWQLTYYIYIELSLSSHINLGLSVPCFRYSFACPAKCGQAMVRLHYVLVPLQVSRMNGRIKCGLAVFPT